jgi:hypothetical protein
MSAPGLAREIELYEARTFWSRRVLEGQVLSNVPTSMAKA